MQLDKWIGISPGCSLLSATHALAENNQIIIMQICFRADQRLVTFIDKKKNKLKKARGTTDKNY